MQERQELATLREKVHRLEIQVAEYSDLLTALQTSHARLQGTVRGRLGGRPRHDETRLSSPDSKAKFRAQLQAQGLLNARYHQHATPPNREDQE